MTTNGLLCPVCRTGLVPTERQAIEIDSCPTCRGVWLDRGELDKIIERSAEVFSPRDAPKATRPDRRYDDDDHFHRRKRKSFLSELFD